MKRLSLFVLLAMLGGCADFLSAMSHVNEGMGSQCQTYSISVAGYSNGEYVEDTFYASDAELVSESNWLEQMKNHYLNQYTFGVYYDRSPVTGNDYKFNVYCSYYY